MTKEEQVLKTFFYSMKPLKLRQLPSKQNKQRVVLDYVISCFDENMEYREIEINEILKDVYEDYATLRRMLIDFHYMNRSKDGSIYQRVVLK